jgi:hypothetical protein
MKNKLLATGIVAAFLLAILPAALAHGGFSGKNLGNREAVQTAIENGDYEAFIEATGKTNLTEEKFDEMIAKKSEQQAQREEIESTLENGDYEAWKDLHQANLEETFNEERFNLMVEMHAAMENEDYEKLQELREEMHEDFGGGFGRMGGGLGMMGGGRGGKRGGGFKGNHICFQE